MPQVTGGFLPVTFPMLLVFACRPPSTEQARPSEPLVYEEDAAPEDLRSYVERAGEGFSALQTELLEALTTEMRREGPLGAIDVCRDAAQRITDRVAETEGFAMGRTSHMLRNPVNAPRPWVRPFVEDGAGRKAAEVKAHVVDLGDRIGVVRPIGFVEMCRNCHGEPATMEPQVVERIRELYPEDEATGFEVGDLRGLFWAEIPEQAR